MTKNDKKQENFLYNLLKICYPEYVNKLYRFTGDHNPMSGRLRSRTKLKEEKLCKLYP